MQLSMLCVHSSSSTIVACRLNRVLSLFIKSTCAANPAHDTESSAVLLDCAGFRERNKRRDQARLSLFDTSDCSGAAPQCAAFSIRASVAALVTSRDTAPVGCFMMFPAVLRSSPVQLKPEVCKMVFCLFVHRSIHFRVVQNGQSFTSS